MFSDKPMMTDGTSATDLRDLAKASGVQTACSASFQVTPSVQQAMRLIADGATGAPTEIECISHFDLERGIPFGWSQRSEDGGGRSNIKFRRLPKIAQTMEDSDIVRIASDLHADLGDAPIVGWVL